MQAQQDIVRSDTTIVETECTPQPTDDHYRIVTNRFWDNWFVLANVGGHAFFGDYGSVGKLSGLLSPDFNVGVGKWFTPGIGAKVHLVNPKTIVRSEGKARRVVDNRSGKM